MTTAERYRVEFGDVALSTTSAPAADLLGSLARAQAEAQNYMDRMEQLVSPSRDQLVDELMVWLQSDDSLDWEAVARARREGW